MMQISKMGKELAGAAHTSDAFADGREMYHKGRLLGVYYYRSNERGRPDEDGAWCSRIIGTVRDNGKNHIVGIDDADDMGCTGQTCSDRTTPCSHAVALIMHVEQDGAFESMPNILYDDINTYMEGYTKEDELADRQMDKQEYESNDEFDMRFFLIGDEQEERRYEEKPFDPEEVKKSERQSAKKDFEGLLRHVPDGMSGLRGKVTMNTEYNTRVFWRMGKISRGAGIAQAVMEFDISMACLQKGVYIYADSGLKKKNHVRFLVNTWKESDRRYVKRVCRNALAELATHDEKWNDDIEKTLKKMMKEHGISIGAARKDYSRGIYGTSVSWLCADILRAMGAGRKAHGR